MANIKLADIVKDCAIEMHDKNFLIFSVSDWKRIIQRTQADAYPRVFRRTYTTVDTTDEKEYDLSDVDPEVRDIENIYVYDDSTDTKPYKLIDWFWDKAQLKLRTREILETSHLMKIEYKTNLVSVEKDEDVLNIWPEHRTLLVMLAVRAALKSLLNDRMKMDKFRTTIDDQTTPYAIANTINMYDRDIEMRLRDVKEKLGPTNVKRPYTEVTDEDSPEYWVKYGE
jgi:hypothetical protein